ncbi:nuclear transport factor 2 family protein [Zhihengliuella flava]|uniref:DUF4878 domain-containing protein n=1 Tax=Zhihengliuella flava TaxID=1285193 RepID=A0A931GEA8_9MICC|nr:hypothetical protein [Zhihengliuella flava]MBG6084243.1 hypothetical protein [Zhihengliuella flava]
MHTTIRARLRRVIAIWAVALIVVLVAAGVAIAVVNAKHFGPERVVADYVAALQEGDGATALGYLNLDAPAEGNGLMLSREPLAASAAALGDVQIEEEDREGDRASVRVSYGVEGRGYHTDFRLVRTGQQWLFFDQWDLQVGKLPQVQVNAANTTDVVVNGTEAPLEAGAATFPVLPPAIVTASFEQQFFRAEETSRIVTEYSDAEDPVQLVSQPTQALTDEVDQQVRAYLDGCTEQQVLMPAGCPLAYDTVDRVDASTIDWEVERYPEIQITGFDGGWVLAPLEADVSLQLTEQDLATGAMTDVDVTETYTFTAKLDVSTSNVTVTPVAVE